MCSYVVEVPLTRACLPPLCHLYVIASGWDGRGSRAWDFAQGCRRLGDSEKGKAFSYCSFPCFDPQKFERPRHLFYLVKPV